MKYTIRKKLGPYPAAHRQPFHNGHCAQIHGHDWHFELVLGANTLDDNGFVYDFGQFDEIKELLRHHFDHTLLLQENDPMLTRFIELQGALVGPLARIVVMPSVSAEGLANFVGKLLVSFIAKQQSAVAQGVYPVSVTVYEDEKNSATIRL